MAVIKDIFLLIKFRIILANALSALCGYVLSGGEIFSSKSVLLFLGIFF
jgi:heme O synthase-like polyprenyltransferase